MKIFLLFMFITVALAAEIRDMSQDEFAQYMARLHRIDPKDSLECIRKTEATIADKRYMDEVMYSSESEITNMTSLRKASCLLACCAQKAGIMVGGEIQLEGLFKHFKESGMPEESHIQMRDAARTCKEQVTDTSDECMAGFRFKKCLFKKM